MNVSRGRMAHVENDKARKLAERAMKHGANIAQFVAFKSDTNGRITCTTAMIRGGLTRKPRSVEEAIDWLYDIGGASNVNIRTYTLEEPEGNPFFLGFRSGFQDRTKAAAKAREMLAKGYRVIINEDIDTTDGFSGVMYDGIVEFAPNDTPRCVEKTGVAALPLSMFQALVYEMWGFHFILPGYSTHDRVEFSAHPRRVGLRREHVVVWEDGRVKGETAGQVVFARWPNALSREIGDKVFGLLVAHFLGLLVPHTTVHAQTLGILSFGQSVPGADGSWWRTSPREQMPGKLTTTHGPFNPFQNMAEDDPKRELIASFIRQQGVNAAYSGACLTTDRGKPQMEGVRGRGDTFMVGEAKPVKLPVGVMRDVKAVWYKLTTGLNGPVSFEWVHDGCQVWVVQLHVRGASGHGDVIVKGEPANGWLEFRFGEDLEILRGLVPRAVAEGKGILLVGEFAVTCHAGDICRRELIPSRRVLEQKTEHAVS